MRPRLLILTPDFPPAHGGVQVLVARLAREMGGFETRVLAPHVRGAEAFDRAGSVATRRCGRALPGHKSRLLALSAGAVTEALRFRPDVTLSAHVVTSPAAALVRRLVGAPTAQYFYAVEIVGKPALAAFAAARAQLAIAISAYSASLLRATGVTPARLRVLHPGVDLPRPGAPRTRAATDTGAPTVVTVASLTYRYKGHDVLASAMAKVRAHLPDVQWVIIGDGPLRARIERVASAQGLGKSAHFLGEVTDALRDDWLSRADVFAMPSRLDGEGFGIAYLEAGAHGTPVVAGSVGGAREAVIDGVTGLLADPADPPAVADAITRLLRDKKLAQRLGENGARRAAKLAWPLVAREVQASLLELVEREP